LAEALKGRERIVEQSFPDDPPAAGEIEVDDGQEPCGTPAARTISRTPAFAKPRRWTTRSPAFRIVSRCDGFGTIVT
jgi:hypothetical protein